VREKFGLNKTLPEQFIIYVSKVFQGDLGYSLIFHSSVSYLILTRLPLSLILVTAGISFATFGGIFLGVIASSKRYGVIDTILSYVSILGFSTPTFWLGQMLLITFSLQLGWLPSGGATTSRVDLAGLDYVVDFLRHLILPAFVLGFYHLAYVFRMTRGTMLEVLQEDFIVTARSKGLSERTVLFKHALKNSLVSIITLISLNFGRLIAGTVLLETVFAWPGLGRLLWSAVLNRDYPLILGLFVFLTVAIVVINLIVDIAYLLIDPRMRHR
jgi:peptide/nickel transport system permease protein